jgi:hypothetical protein
MTFAIDAGRVGWQPIGVSDTTQRHALGTKVRAIDPTYGAGEFVYAKGVAATTAGSVVLFDQDGWTTTLAAANDKGSLGTAMSANVAGQYGWYQVFGKGVAKVLAGFVDNADCYLTATAGSVDDADVAGDFIVGMKGASGTGTPSAGLAEVELFYPRVTDGADD